MMSAVPDSRFERTVTRQGSAGLALLRAAIVSTLAVSAAGCAKHGDTTGSLAPAPDYRERHPIVLANAPRTLDIFAVRGAGGLDRRQIEDIQAFAAEYRSAGQGIITIGIPIHGTSQQVTLAAVRKVLSETGVSSRYVAIGQYEPDDQVAAAPLRLRFIKLQAKVDSLCGQWWQDVNGAGTAETFRNQSPSNFGCAYQTSIAAQVANPIDLQRPRQEGPIDVLKRSNDIGTLRDHKDPSTNWKVNAGQVGSTGQ